VDVPDIEWAHALALEGAESMHAGFVKYSTDPQEFAGLIQRVLDLLRVAPGKCMTERDLKRKLGRHLKRKKDLEEALQYLAEAEYLVCRQKPPTKQGGRTSYIVELLPELLIAARNRF
jgi:hypothetical protein